MKALQLPPWLAKGVVERYQSGGSHLFLLHGNVRDLQPFGEEYLPLGDGLARLAGRRSVVVRDDVSSGLSFPDKEREATFRRVLGIKAKILPADPTQALFVIDALLSEDRAEPGSVAVILDYAHSLAPA